MIRATTLAALTAACLAALPAAAQMSAEVQFEPGNYGTNVGGTVIGDEYFDYTLRAKAGQEMFAELDVTDSNGNGTVYFNILPPGSDGEAIFIGSRDGNTAQVELPSSGVYTIRVYQMGNDADTGKTSGYRVDLSIQ